MVKKKKSKISNSLMFQKRIENAKTEITICLPSPQQSRFLCVSAYLYTVNKIFALEPGVRLFLKTIVQTMSLAMLWMLLNTYFGIKLGLLFLDEGITAWHVVYYICLVASFIFLLRHILAKWKKVPKFGREEDFYEEDEPR